MISNKILRISLIFSSLLIQLFLYLLFIFLMPVELRYQCVFPHVADLNLPSFSHVLFSFFWKRGVNVPRDLQIYYFSKSHSLALLILWDRISLDDSNKEIPINSCLINVEFYLCLPQKFREGSLSQTSAFIHGDLKYWVYSSTSFYLCSHGPNDRKSEVRTEQRTFSSSLWRKILQSFYRTHSLTHHWLESIPIKYLVAIAFITKVYSHNYT